MKEINEITHEEAIEFLEDGCEIKLKYKDNEFIIGDMHDYIGSPDNEEGYISEYLGNVWYSSSRNIIYDTMYGMVHGDTSLFNDIKFYYN